MKKAIIKSASAIALLAGSSMAFAGPSDKVVYSNPVLQAVNTAPPVSIPFFGPVSGPAAAQNTWDAAQTPISNALGLQQVSGARYQQSSTTQGDTEAATATQTAKFTLSGTVNPDCSFYSASNNGQQAINLGTIGVRTGNNDNVTVAFNQVDAINANVNTSTAGCNTQNQITITKGNGASGLLNAAAVAYDTNQFTNKIPYSVKATWQGVALGAPTIGTQQTLTATANDSFKAVQVGAWRSAFNLDVNAPVQSKGLIAGTYSDTITVELKAL